MHGKMFTHVWRIDCRHCAHSLQIYAECLKPINEIQHCKRTQGPAHPDCIVQWDDLFLCYTEANCPTRYAKADKCIKGLQLSYAERSLSGRRIRERELYFRVGRAFCVRTLLLEGNARAGGGESHG